jgi:hypothetical protein
VTEPLADGRIAMGKGWNTVGSLATTVHDEESVLQVPVEEVSREYQPGHRRQLTWEDLNKPLPPVLVRVPFKIKVDQSFTWDEDAVRSPSLDERRVASDNRGLRN